MRSEDVLSVGFDADSIVSSPVSPELPQEENFVELIVSIIKDATNIATGVPEGPDSQKFVWGMQRNDGADLFLRRLESAMVARARIITRSPSGEFNNSFAAEILGVRRTTLVERISDDSTYFSSDVLGRMESVAREQFRGLPQRWRLIDLPDDTQFSDDFTPVFASALRKSRLVTEHVPAQGDRSVFIEGMRANDGIIMLIARIKQALVTEAMILSGDVSPRGGNKAEAARILGMKRTTLHEFQGRKCEVSTMKAQSGSRSAFMAYDTRMERLRSDLGDNV